MKPKVYLNKDFSISLREVLNIVHPKHIFLVTSKMAFKMSGAKVVCDDVLSNFKVTYFDDFEVNPHIEDIQVGITAFKESDADLIVAIGGGSAIDMAKSINALSTDDDVIDCVTNKKNLAQKSVPLVAVPTTAGSGSEATHFAVVYIDEKKYSLAHESILPNFVIIDASLTSSLPATVTASTGLDALAQGIESYWSVNATDESKKYAKQAILLASKNLESAVHDPDTQSRKAMSEAAYCAGKAINISKTTASHAMSYPLTTRFGIAHGHAVALTLPQVFGFNAEVINENVVDSRGVTYVKKILNEIVLLLGCSTISEVQTFLESLIVHTGLSTKLNQFGVTKKDIDTFLESISTERPGNNPRVFTKEDARRIYTAIL